MKIDYKTPEMKVVVLKPRRCLALSPNSAEAYGYLGTYDSNYFDDENEGSDSSQDN